VRISKRRYLSNFTADANGNGTITPDWMNGTSVSGDPTKIFRERTWPSKALMTSFYNHQVTQEPKLATQPSLK
jgi:hypothetical protein